MRTSPIRWGAAPAVSPCAALRLSENWAPGGSTSHGSAHWETAAGPSTGSSSPDALYPSAVASEYVRISTGLGPAGENVLDAFNGTTFTNSAYVWTVPKYRGDCGTIAIDFNISTAAMASLPTSAFLARNFVQVFTSKAAFTTGDFSVLAHKSGANVVFTLRYLDWSSGSVSVATATLTQASVIDTWKTLTLQWHVGTWTSGLVGSNIGIATVATDGWIKVWFGSDLLYDLTGLDLYLHNGNAAVDRINEIGTIAVGYYGLPGLMTNLSLRGGSDFAGTAYEMPPYVEQANATYNTDGEGTFTVSHTLTSAVTAGRDVLAVVSMYSAPTTTPGTVTDNQGNTYTLIADHGVTDGSRCRVYKTTCGSSGTLTITYTPATSEYVTLGAVGLDCATTVDVTGGYDLYTPANTTHTAGLASTTGPNRIVIGFCINNGGDGTLVAGSGWTPLITTVDPTNFQSTLAMSRRYAIAAGVTDPTWTSSANAYNALGVALARA